MTAAAPDVRTTLLATRDEDKDGDPRIDVTVRLMVVASISDEFGHFGDHSYAGPFDLPLTQAATREADRCQAMIRRSNASISAFSAHARYFREPCVLCIGDDFDNGSTPLRPTGATIPNSARYARIELMIAVC